MERTKADRRGVASEAVDVGGDTTPFCGTEHESLVYLSEPRRLGLEFGHLLNHLSSGQLEVADVGRGCRIQFTLESITRSVEIEMSSTHHDPIARPCCSSGSTRAEPPSASCSHP